MKLYINKNMSQSRNSLIYLFVFYEGKKQSPHTIFRYISFLDWVFKYQHIEEKKYLRIYIWKHYGPLRGVNRDLISCTPTSTFTSISK